MISNLVFAAASMPLPVESLGEGRPRPRRSRAGRTLIETPLKPAERKRPGARRSARPLEERSAVFRMIERVDEGLDVRVSVLGIRLRQRATIAATLGETRRPRDPASARRRAGAGPSPRGYCRLRRGASHQRLEEDYPQGVDVGPRVARWPSTCSGAMSRASRRWP